LKYTPVEPLLK